MIFPSIESTFALLVVSSKNNKIMNVWYFLKKLKLIYQIIDRHILLKIVHLCQRFSARKVQSCFFFQSPTCCAVRYKRFFCPFAVSSHTHSINMLYYTDLIMYNVYQNGIIYLRAYIYLLSNYQRFECHFLFYFSY